MLNIVQTASLFVWMDQGALRIKQRSRIKKAADQRSTNQKNRRSKIKKESKITDQRSRIKKTSDQDQKTRINESSGSKLVHGSRVIAVHGSCSSRVMPNIERRSLKTGHAEVHIILSDPHYHLLSTQQEGISKVGLELYLCNFFTFS